MKNDDISLLIRAAVETGLNVTGHPIQAKIAGPVLARFMAVASDWFSEKNRRKFEDWLHEIAASNEYASVEDTIKLIEAHIDEPWAHGPLEDVVRAIRDGIDEAALVYLAKLAAWQIRDNVPPDRWSRRAVRLLLDCDVRIVKALVHFSSHLPSHWPKGYADIVWITMGGPNAMFANTVSILPVGGNVTEAKVDDAWEPQPLYRELFALLRVHQFATDEGGRLAHEGKMMIAKEQALYLVRLFHGATKAAEFPR